jgi:hypothetical protein
MVDVFVNGVKFVNGTDFTATDGTTVVMAAALAAGNIVEIDNLLTAYLPTNALRTITTFTATAAQTTFSVSYTQGLIDVFYNGSNLAQSEYTATNGTSIILATACQLNDIVVVYAYSYSVGAYSGIGGSGTSGQVPYFTSSSAIASSPNHFWDATNNRLGIGTSTPNFILDVKQATNQHFYIGAGITVSGAIAIGGGNDAANANIPIEMRYATTFAFVDAGTEKMRISGNNLNIGNTTQTSTTTPVNISLGGTFGTTLANGTKIKLFDNSTVAHGIGVISGNLYLNTNDSTTEITFNTNNTERMRITSGGAVQLSKGQLEFTGSNGSVELGTTVGIIKYDSSNVVFYYGTGDLIFKTNSGAIGDIAFFKQDGTIRFAKYTSNGTLTTTSSNGTIAVSSDKNMKIDAGIVENGLEKVLSLKPRYFYWKDEEKFGNKKQLGFYAQEVNEISEEASNTPEEGQGWGIYDRALIAILTKAIQEMNAKIIELEKIVATK